jgi:hypothetical protein
VLKKKKKKKKKRFWAEKTVSNKLITMMGFYPRGLARTSTQTYSCGHLILLIGIKLLNMGLAIRHQYFISDFNILLILSTFFFFLSKI